ncbi:hypothetical protein JK179_03475 [Gluconobacter wancherniae]|nr:hypothetical protein [Gluconobacter wancherniae]
MTAATVMITGTIAGMDTDVVLLAHMQAWAAEYALQTAITADNKKLWLQHRGVVVFENIQCVCTSSYETVRAGTLAK